MPAESTPHRIRAVPRTPSADGVGPARRCWIGADPIPDDLRHALDAINGTSPGTSDQDR